MRREERRQEETRGYKRGDEGRQDRFMVSYEAA